MRLSTLVRRAANGPPVAVTVRGRVAAYLVSPETVEGARQKQRVPVRGSLTLHKPLEGSRADFLRWLRGED